MPEAKSVYRPNMSAVGSDNYLSSLNLIDAWVPSQNGLFCDAPHRHKVTRLRTSYSKPSELNNCIPPRNHSGPEHS